MRLSQWIADIKRRKNMLGWSESPDSLRKNKENNESSSLSDGIYKDGEYNCQESFTVLSREQIPVTPSAHPNKQVYKQFVLV